MIHVIKGKAVFDVLFEDLTRTSWDELYKTCNWATAFQNQKYITSWYELYQDSYIPLLIMDKSDNRINGIFPLAITSNGEIVGAGHSQAEYQVWLCSNENCTRFFLDATKKLRTIFPECSIHLKYIPHLTPLQDLMRNASLRKNAFWVKHSQPVMEINLEHINHELKKKNRKEKINRLKRIGEIKFEKIEDVELLINNLDHLITEYDFRKAAMYGEEYFAMDQHKKELMLKLFQNDLLHVTWLKVSDKIIAANAGVVGKGIVHLQGFDTHSPQYSRYSPGIIRFLMLGLKMHSEGLKEFDLTPGGIKKGYKSELATKFYDVYEVIIDDPKRITALRIQKKLKSSVINYIPEDIKEKTKNFIDNLKLKWKLLRIKKILGSNVYQLRSNRMMEPNGENIKWSKIERNFHYSTYSPSDIKWNSLRDLLKYKEIDIIMSKQRFLFEAMKRIEYGHQVFTLTLNDELISCLWFIPEGAKIDFPVIGKSQQNQVFLSLIKDIKTADLNKFLIDGVNSVFYYNPKLDKVFLKYNSQMNDLNKLEWLMPINYSDIIAAN